MTSAVKEGRTAGGDARSVSTRWGSAHRSGGGAPRVVCSAALATELAQADPRRRGLCEALLEQPRAGLPVDRALVFVGDVGKPRRPSPGEHAQRARRLGLGEPRGDRARAWFTAATPGASRASRAAAEDARATAPRRSSIGLVLDARLKNTVSIAAAPRAAGQARPALPVSRAAHGHGARA